MSKYIIKKRGDGKTTDLIKESAEKGLYIICCNRQRVQSIVQQAQKLGYNIPFPVTLEEILLSRSHGGRPFGLPYILSKGKVLVDDVDDIMQELAGMPCAIITGTLEEDNEN